MVSRKDQPNSKTDQDKKKKKNREHELPISGMKRKDIATGLTSIKRIIKEYIHFYANVSDKPDKMEKFFCISWQIPTTKMDIRCKRKLE